MNPKASLATTAMIPNFQASLAQVVKQAEVWAQFSWLNIC